MPQRSPATPPQSRRKEYAEATRQAILQAARELFERQGFFTTKVDEIAALARVAPATVYAVSGGKQGLLRTLAEIWTSAPEVAAKMRKIEEVRDPQEILRLCATTCVVMKQKYGGLIRVILDTAPHDCSVAETLATATGHYRAALALVAGRLRALDALRPGIDAETALGLLWFYFGYSALFTLVDESGWSYDQAEKWLGDAAIQALLRGR